MPQEVITTLVLLFVSITVTFIIATDIANRRWTIKHDRALKFVIEHEQGHAEVERKLTEEKFDLMRQRYNRLADKHENMRLMLAQHSCPNDGLFVAVMHDTEKGAEFVLIHAGDKQEAYNTGCQLAEQTGFVLLSIEPADTIVSEQYDGYATLGTFNGGGF